MNFDHLIFGFVSTNFIKSGDIRISDLLGKTLSSAIIISQNF